MRADRPARMFLRVSAGRLPFTVLGFCLGGGFTTCSGAWKGRAGASPAQALPSFRSVWRSLQIPQMYAMPMKLRAKALEVQWGFEIRTWVPLAATGRKGLVSLGRRRFRRTSREPNEETATNEG